MKSCLWEGEWVWQEGALSQSQLLPNHSWLDRNLKTFYLVQIHCSGKYRPHHFRGEDFLRSVTQQGNRKEVGVCALMYFYHRKKIQFFPNAECQRANWPFPHTHHWPIVLQCCSQMTTSHLWNAVMLAQIWPMKIFVDSGKFPYYVTNGIKNPTTDFLKLSAFAKFYCMQTILLICEDVVSLNDDMQLATAYYYILVCWVTVGVSAQSQSFIWNNIPLMSIVLL